MNWAFEVVGQFVGFIVLWCAAMAYHLWMILTLRPQFQLLADSARTLISFTFICGLAAFAKLAVFGKWHWAMCLLGGFSYPFTLYLVCAVWLGTKTSHVPASMLMGVSAVVDALVVVMALAGISPNEVHPVMRGMEVVWSLWVAWVFSKQPPDVKKSGYRPLRGADLTAQG